MLNSRSISRMKVNASKTGAWRNLNKLVTFHCFLFRKGWILCYKFYFHSRWFQWRTSKSKFQQVVTNIIYLDQLMGFLVVLSIYKLISYYSTFCIEIFIFFHFASFCSPYALRRVNDQLMLLERAFISDRWKDDNNVMYPWVQFF